MRGAQVLRLVAALGLAGLGAIGCGDDSGTTPDAAVDAPVDGRADGPSTPDAAVDAGPTHSVTIAAIEAHGIAGTQAGQPVFAMVADVQISVTPRTFMDDIPTQSPPFGCTGNEFFLDPGDAGAPDLPPDNGDVGNITVNGYSGRGNTTTAIPAPPLTCTRGSTYPHSYDCMVPTTTGQPFILEGVGSVQDPANFLGDTDSLTYNVAGGANSDAFMMTATATPAVMVTNGNTLQGPQPTLPDADLAIHFTCPGGACGAVTVNLASSDNPTGTPNHYASITCTKLSTATSGGNGSDTITIPQNYLQLIKNNPTWAIIRTTVLRFGSPNLDLTNFRTAVAGQGQFFIATHQ